MCVGGSGGRGRAGRWRVSWKWVVLWSLWAARATRHPTPELRVRSGLLRGEIAPDGSHAAYRAIPYATYDARFQAPKPVPPWKGVYEAVEEHIRCPQRFGAGVVLGREDCLTLNVYTPPPAAAPQHPLPVMVFIHGGGFRDGSGSPALYGPEYLIPHDVILVTINYRLEILGFLCLGIEEAPGNMGLKDQIEALKWVKENIRAFGGDPDYVTLFGESAGAASVGFHLLTHLSKGLFHKAIMQSGSPLSPWSFQWEPLKTASMLARQMGFDTTDPHELHKIFMNMTADELLLTRIPREVGDVVLSENVFVPCLDAAPALLPATPYELLAAGHFTRVPIIIGHNNAEGWMFVGKENDSTIANFDFRKALPRDLEFPSEEEARKVADGLNEIYAGGRNVSKERLGELTRYEGDAGITYSVLVTAELLSRVNAHVYTYRCDHDGWLNLAKLAFGAWRERGATHADELFYMFKPRITFINSFLETEMIQTVTTLWTNFAKYSEPMVRGRRGARQRWPAAAGGRAARALVIDTQLHLAPFWDPEDRAMLFWNQTYTKYRRKLIQNLK